MILWALHVLNLRTRWAGPSTAKSSDCLGLECSGSSPWRLGSRKARDLLSHSNPGVAYVGVLSYVLQVCHSNHRQVCGMRLQAYSPTGLAPAASRPSSSGSSLQIFPPPTRQCRGLGSIRPLPEAPTHPVHCPTMQSWTPWLKEDAKPWALLF